MNMSIKASYFVASAFHYWAFFVLIISASVATERRRGNWAKETNERIRFAFVK